MIWFLILAIVSLLAVVFFLWPEIKKNVGNEQAGERGREYIASSVDNLSYRIVTAFYRAVHFLVLAGLSLLQYVMFGIKIVTGKLEKRFARTINLLKGKEPWHNKKGAVSVYLQQLDSRK